MSVQLSVRPAEQLYRLAIGGAGRRGRRRALRLGAGVDPTAMHPPVEGVGRLGIDGALPDDATESRLNVAGRAAEAVVQVEMAEGGIEIVAPEQADHPPAEPDAFRAAGGTTQELLRLGKFVDFLRGILALGGGRLVGRLLLRALGECRGSRQQHRRAQGGGNKTQTRTGHGRSDTMGRGRPVAVLYMRPHSVSIAATATATRKARRFKQPRERTPRPRRRPRLLVSRFRSSRALGSVAAAR